MQIFRTPNFDWTPMGCNSVVFGFSSIASSETQGQIVGARESLNGRKKMAPTKVKNGEKSPCWQCFTRPVPDSQGRSVLESGILGNKPHWQWGNSPLLPSVRTQRSYGIRRYMLGIKVLMFKEDLPCVESEYERRGHWLRDRENRARVREGSYCTSFRVATSLGCISYLTPLISYALVT